VPHYKLQDKKKRSSTVQDNDTRVGYLGIFRKSVEVF